MPGQLGDLFDWGPGGQVVIGQGAFAVVCKIWANSHPGRSHQGSQPLALKVIAQAPIEARGMRRQVIQEMTIQQDLNHPHILRCFHAVQLSGHYWMVLEYAGFGCLSDRAGQMSAAAVATCLFQTASALQYLHTEMHILHRDVKAANVLAIAPSLVKLADFGWSVRVSANDLPSGKAGTPSHMAPEVYRGLPHGFGADCWSFGVLVYEMLTGHLPFQQQTDLLKAEYTTPAGIPPLAADLVDKLLHCDPSQRLRAAELSTHGFLQTAHTSADPNPLIQSTSTVHSGSSAPAFVPRRQAILWEPGQHASAGPWIGLMDAQDGEDASDALQQVLNADALPVDRASQLTSSLPGTPQTATRSLRPYPRFGAGAGPQLPPSGSLQQNESVSPCLSVSGVGSGRAQQQAFLNPRLATRVIRHPSLATMSSAMPILKQVQFAEPSAAVSPYLAAREAAEGGAAASQQHAPVIQHVGLPAMQMVTSAVCSSQQPVATRRWTSGFPSASVTFVVGQSLPKQPTGSTATMRRSVALPMCRPMLGGS